MKYDILAITHRDLKKVYHFKVIQGDFTEQEILNIFKSSPKHILGIKEILIKKK